MHCFLYSSVFVCPLPVPACVDVVAADVGGFLPLVVLSLEEPRILKEDSLVSDIVWGCGWMQVVVELRDSYIVATIGKAMLIESPQMFISPRRLVVGRAGDPCLLVSNAKCIFTEPCTEKIQALSWLLRPCCTTVLTPHVGHDQVIMAPIEDMYSICLPASCVSQIPCCTRDCTWTSKPESILFNESRKQIRGPCATPVLRFTGILAQLLP